MKLKPYEHWFSNKPNSEIDYRSLVENAFKVGTPDKNKKVIKQIYGRDEKGRYDLFIYEDGSQNKVYL
jgi:hypothetical protein